MRRQMTLACLLALCLAPLSATAAEPSFETSGLALLSLIEARYGRAGNLYTETVDAPKRAGNSAIWDSGVQLSALNAAARVAPEAWGAKARTYADALAQYRTENHGVVGYQPYPSAKAGVRYYDDNEWLVLAFLETAELSSPADKGLVDRAQQAMDFVTSGYSSDLGGGIWWRENRDSKNTCSNAPAICGALRLFQLTGNAADRSLADVLYAWTNQRLQDTDSLFLDHLRRDGSIDKTKWSYNSALMIRANCLFYQVTKEKRYLDEARRIAAAAEAHWFRPSDGALTDEAPFAHLLCESLLFLSDLDRDHSHVEKVFRALRHLQTLNRDGFYPKRWDGWTKADEKGHPLIFQASAARAFLVASRYD